MRPAVIFVKDDDDGKGDAAAAVSEDDGFGRRTPTIAKMKKKMKDDCLIPKAAKQRSLLVLSGFFVWQLVPVEWTEHETLW